MLDKSVASLQRVFEALVYLLLAVIRWYRTSGSGRNVAWQRAARRRVQLLWTLKYLVSCSAWNKGWNLKFYWYMWYIVMLSTIWWNSVRDSLESKVYSLEDSGGIEVDSNAGGCQVAEYQLLYHTHHFVLGSLTKSSEVQWLRKAWLPQPRCFMRCGMMQSKSQLIFATQLVIFTCTAKVSFREKMAKYISILQHSLGAKSPEKGWNTWKPSHTFLHMHSFKREHIFFLDLKILHVLHKSTATYKWHGEIQIQ